MKIGIQGSRNFYDYAIFLNAMTSILQYMPEDDTELIFFSAGPHKVNDMLHTFVNVPDWNRRDKTIRPKVVKLPVKVLEQKMHELDEFVYLCIPKEPEGYLVKVADNVGLIPKVSRY